MRDIIILGGGLAGISAAYFLQDKPDVKSIKILEKERYHGGLCRSMSYQGYTYDVGPHIIFSKDKETLGLMHDLLGDNKNQLKRSNKIIYKGAYVNYPFENDLSKLPKEDLDYCINMFINNPYATYEAKNMLQFFLKIFGEGITNLYLRPYNEKIWKFDPTFMNTAMVERIPKPTEDEIEQSAAGKTVEGYLHQLYFHYPKAGGIQALVDAFISRFNDKVSLITDVNITGIKTVDRTHEVVTDDEVYKTKYLISTMPVQALTQTYQHTNEEIVKTVDDLKYNSLYVALVNVKENKMGDHFAFTIADKSIIFHRMSSIDFLGKNYSKGGATFMVEVTFRDGDNTDNMSLDEIEAKIIDGLTKVGTVEDESEINFIHITKHKYAYVIYDIKHIPNIGQVRTFYRDRGIMLHGRFGNFEYWNMDRIIAESKQLAEKY